MRNMCAVQMPRPLTATSSAIDLLVGELVQALELELAGDHVLGERAQEADLRAREAGGGAQLFGVVGEDLLRRRRAVVEARGQPAVDRARRQHRELLAGDRAHERAVVVVAVGAAVARIAERADRVDQRREHRVRARRCARPARRRHRA